VNHAVETDDAPAGDVVLITVSVPDEATGDRIADEVVQDRLAACVKRSGPVRSVYRWQGAVEHDDEWVLSCITVADRVAALSRRVRELHPYEVPEVVVTAVVDGTPDYLAWVRASSSPA
jgi:periplasmic divalent cation tolerance protein